jgi:uncharacterized protein (TIGR00730 family)
MFTDADEIVVTANMHERKQVMFERADAFVALPGGIGTLEELIEQLTWAQLGRHKKPILVANIAGFWDLLVNMFEHFRISGMLPAGSSVEYLVTTNVEEILPLLSSAAANVSTSKARGEPERVQRM